MSSFRARLSKSTTFLCPAFVNFPRPQKKSCLRVVDVSILLSKELKSFKFLVLHVAPVAVYFLDVEASWVLLAARAVLRVANKCRSDLLNAIVFKPDHAQLKVLMALIVVRAQIILLEDGISLLEDVDVASLVKRLDVTTFASMDKWPTFCVVDFDTSNVRIAITADVLVANHDVLVLVLVQYVVLHVTLLG